MHTALQKNSSENIATTNKWHYENGTKTITYYSRSRFVAHPK